MEKSIDQAPSITDQIQQMVEILRALSNSDDCKNFIALLHSPACKKMVHDYRDFITLLVKSGEVSRELWEPAFEVLSQISQSDRDRLLELALQAQPAFEEQVPAEDVLEFTEKAEYRFDSFFPKFSEWTRTEKIAVIRTIIDIVEFLLTYFKD